MQGVEIDQAYLDQKRAYGQHGARHVSDGLYDIDGNVQWKLFDRNNKETGLSNICAMEITTDHHVITEQTTKRDYANPLNLVRSRQPASATA